jgi:hypothetical protein
MADEDLEPFVADESTESPTKEKNKPVATTLVPANSDFINNKWRPMMAWTYMAICICDFILFPVLWSSLQALQHGAVSIQWVPITLEDSGLLHIAMGAVLGIAAYGRTQEKLQDRM